MSKKDNKELKMEMEKIISFLDGIHDFFTNHAVALSPFDPDGTEMLLEGGVLFLSLIHI